MRVAGVCGLLAFVTFNIGWIAGGLTQPDSYSFADDDISDLGAMTARSAWLYNQVGANLTGLLVVALALGLWRALSPDMLGRVGAGALAVGGVGAFHDGIFRLHSRGIDAISVFTWDRSVFESPASGSSSSSTRGFCASAIESSTRRFSP